MWIVKLALTRPYTFVVFALLIFVLSPLVILRTPTDIFPNIDIPVISVASSVDRANSQVVSASQFALRLLPSSIQPPEIINFSASSVPILQLGLSGHGLSEQQLNDLALNFVRTQMITVPGAVIPLPYGGKQRQVMINLDHNLMQARNISPTDVLNAVNTQSLVLPSGTVKLGQSELDIRANTYPRTVAELNNLPIKQVGDTTVYLRDVATASDGFALQTNVVRQDGRRGVLMSILKAGNASTLSVVSGVKTLLPRVATIVPPALKMTPLADQSIFVQSAVSGVIREAVIAAALTGLMILLFLGSWRSTLIIAVSIPLSILTSIMIISLLGETINIMTLGGLALAVGILVDDATVTIENIERVLRQGRSLHDGILEGAAQIAVPALVSTLCICIVFLPMFLLDGVARYLFVPLAEAVVFAMLASYVLSRTLVPTLAMYLLKAKRHEPNPKNIFARLQHGFEKGFESVRNAYSGLLTSLVAHRKLFIPAFLGACLCGVFLVPWLGQDFFPDTDSGQFILHVRARTGTRIEETSRLFDLVEDVIRQNIPPKEMDNILDNIGLPYSPYNTMHSTSGVLGANDGDVLVSLRQNHSPVADYVRDLRTLLPQRFPGVTFYFLPADIVTQILDFGLPSPIDVQVEGNDVVASQQIAEKVMVQMRQVPGLVDLRVQQPLDYPTLDVAVDRVKALQAGYTEQNVANSVLNALSGSFQITPLFFMNWKNGVNYNLVAQTPQYRFQSINDLLNIPLPAASGSNTEILGDVASVSRGHEMGLITHYNIRRVIDIYGAVQDRDLGAVSRDVQKIVDNSRQQLPRGTFLTIRGQVRTMESSYAGLLTGLALAVVLVYMLIVINFQSWLDPFIIITALPAALTGIVLFLFLTHTTLSVPALMGALMCMGIATANSILVVSFAKERLREHGDSVRASIESGATRFRPVVMTALAMIIGMIPMALGLGDGGEQNAPLGRAVIGGLLAATVATLVFVPAVFSMLHQRTSRVGTSEAEQLEPVTNS